MSEVKEVGKRVSDRIKNILGDTRETKGVLRNSFKELTRETGPIRSILENRETLILGEPLIKRLRRR